MNLFDVSNDIWRDRKILVILRSEHPNPVDSLALKAMLLIAGVEIETSELLTALARLHEAGLIKTEQRRLRCLSFTWATLTDTGLAATEAA